MTDAIGHFDPGHDNPTLFGELWVTWATDWQTGARYPHYVRNEFFGMSGCTNQNAHGDIPLGQLHPNCLVCNQKGYCRHMCPIERPGFTCTVSMSHEDQEMGWSEGFTKERNDGSSKAV